MIIKKENKILRRGDAETRRRGELFAVAILFLFVLSSTIYAQNHIFEIVSKDQTAEIVISENDFKVVKIVADALAGDIELVSDKRPKIKTGTPNLAKQVIIIGTLGKNELIEQLIKEKKIDVSQITQKRESYLITTVINPFPDVEKALVIIGSDRRGTAYGAFQISEKIGVSPWVWWADVRPQKWPKVPVLARKIIGGEPSVKYRGIFLNDEDWGLQPWAARSFEPETGDIGPKTYAKIFELLLRLKANTCWPAMHEVTKPFNEIAENKQVADDYAIIMGSSHAEPMLRNNVGEWKDEKEKYNFISNEKGVTNYWQVRAKSNGKYENIWTLGMRGIHDSPIQGTKDQTERIAVLEKIIKTQRGLLTEYVDENIEKVPQIFCPYKEVLADYRAGLRVPDDVTIVFPDDNFGYIRSFPNAEEQKRKGGFGVYYHISYLGRPLSYLWLNTTPPALIREEMVKAFDNGMRDFWMLNVGDIKPAELGIEYFFNLAYDERNWRSHDLKFLAVWANREFGRFSAREIIPLMDKYFRLGFQRKPEHLQWYLPNESPRKSDFSAISYGDETQKRLDDYTDIREKAEKIYQNLSPEKKDAFYQLVLYPVRSAALANERFFAAEKAMLYHQQGRASAVDWAKRAINADAAIKKDAAYFNEKIAGGKWRGMMSPEMNEGQWKSMRSTPPKISDEILNRAIPAKAKLGVVIEGQENPFGENELAVLPKLDVFTKEKRFIDVFNEGKSAENWTAIAKQDWIKLSQTDGNLREDKRIFVSIDWKNTPFGEDVKGEIIIKTADESRKIMMTVFNPQMSKLEADFVESNGVISIEAENYSKNSNMNGFTWNVVRGLGKTGDSVTVFPQIAHTFAAGSPGLEYRIYVFNAGDFEANFFLIPTRPLIPENGLRFAVSVDNQKPQIISVDKDTEVSSPKWAQNILNQTTVGKTKIKLEKGSHILKIFAVDTGVVLDKIVLDAGGMKESYLGPPETKIVE